MAAQAIELQQRTARFLRAVEELAPKVSGEKRGQTLLGSLLKSSREVEAGYRHACASATPAQFVSRISVVARNAKKAKASLMLLAQLGYVQIDAAREAIIEARALESIFAASRNTAKRRQSGRPVSRRQPSERATERKAPPE